MARLINSMKNFQFPRSMIAKDGTKHFTAAKTTARQEADQNSHNRVKMHVLFISS